MNIHGPSTFETNRTNLFEIERHRISHDQRILQSLYLPKFMFCFVFFVDAWGSTFKSLIIENP